MASGWASREKPKGAMKRVHYQAPIHEDNSMAVTPFSLSDDEFVDVQPLQVSRDMPQISGPKSSSIRLGPIILFYFCFFNTVTYLIVV
jgi:hypothetical protein